MKTNKTPLDIAIDYFGGNQTKLAHAIDPGLSPMNITNWKTRGVPPKWFYQINLVTEGAVSIDSLYQHSIQQSAA